MENRSKQIKTFKGIVDVKSTILRGSCIDELTGAPLNPPKPANDLDFNSKLIFSIDFENDRMRCDTTMRYYQPDVNEVHQWKHINTFDGVDGYIQDQGHTNLDGKLLFGIEKFKNATNYVVIFKDQKKSKSEIFEDLISNGFSPILMMVGILPECRKFGTFDPNYTLEEFRIIGNTKWKNNNVVILRHYFSSNKIVDSNYEDYWLDQDHEYRMVRNQVYAMTYLLYDTQMNDYVIYGKTSTLRSWRFNHYSNSKIERTNFFTIIDPQVNGKIPINEFRIPIRPKMIVGVITPESYEQMLQNPESGTTYYKVNENGKWDESDEKGKLIKRTKK